VNMDFQEETHWCWAAVAVAIHNFLNPGGPKWQQADVATPVLLAEGQIDSGVNCSLTPGKCNIDAALDDALEITGNLRQTGFHPDSHLTFDNIKEWVNAELPVGVRIRWWGGTGHFVAIDGFRELQSGRLQVHVQDPKYGPSFQDYDDLVSGYRLGGDWQDTYLVKKSSLAPPDGDI